MRKTTQTVWVVEWTYKDESCLDGCTLHTSRENLEEYLRKRANGWMKPFRDAYEHEVHQNLYNEMLDNEGLISFPCGPPPADYDPRKPVITDSIITRDDCVNYIREGLKRGCL